MLFIESLQPLGSEGTPPLLMSVSIIGSGHFGLDGLSRRGLALIYISPLWTMFKFSGWQSHPSDTPFTILLDSLSPCLAFLNDKITRAKNENENKNEHLCIMSQARFGSGLGGVRAVYDAGV
jgi:hypothetical protein